MYTYTHTLCRSLQQLALQAQLLSRCLLPDIPSPPLCPSEIDNLPSPCFPHLLHPADSAPLFAMLSNITKSAFPPSQYLLSYVTRRFPSRLLPHLFSGSFSHYCLTTPGAGQGWTNTFSSRVCLARCFLSLCSHRFDFGLRLATDLKSTSGASLYAVRTIAWHLPGGDPGENL